MLGKMAPAWVDLRDASSGGKVSTLFAQDGAADADVLLVLGTLPSRQPQRKASASNWWSPIDQIFHGVAQPLSTASYHG